MRALFLPCFACSGPGAAALIRESIEVGNWLAVGSAIVTMLVFLHSVISCKLTWSLPIAVLLLVFHPAWTISATQGDCGTLKTQLSWWFGCAYLAILVRHVWTLMDRQPQVSPPFSPVNDNGPANG